MNRILKISDNIYIYIYIYGIYSIFKYFNSIWLDLTRDPCKDGLD